MRMQWIRFKRFIRLYAYILLIFICSFTLISLSIFQSGSEIHQVRLDDEIKDEIDLSLEVDDDKWQMEKPYKLSHIKSGDRKPSWLIPNMNDSSNREHIHQEIYEEELSNLALFGERNKKLAGKIYMKPSAADNPENDPPCIGKHAQDQFKFHHISKEIYIYSAFWDPRWNDFDNKQNRTFIRMMGINNRDNDFPPLSCLFFIRGAYHIIPAYDYEMCESHNKIHAGHIYSCEVPQAIKKHICSVLVAYGDTADPKWATRIPVFNTQLHQKRYKFSQCVPPLFGNIDEGKLIEFIELSRMLGSEHLSLYDLRAPSNIKRILEYYKLKGIITVSPWPLPQLFDNGNLWYHGQIIATQDCLYRNMATTDFLAFNDLDEYIIPNSHKTWHDLVRNIDRDEYCGYVFKSSFFDHRQSVKNYDWIKDFRYLTIAENVMRTEMISKFRNKCLVKPNQIFEKGIHHISKPITASLGIYEVKTEMALLHHYRVCTGTYGQNCEKFVKDRSAWKYVPRLHDRVQLVKKWMAKL